MVFEISELVEGAILRGIEMMDLRIGYAFLGTGNYRSMI